MDLKLEDLKKSLGRMYSRIPPMVGRSRIFSYQYHHHSSLSPHWIITCHHSNQDVVGVSAGGVRLKILL